MSLSKICLKNSYRLTFVSLAVTLAGCSLNPFSNDASQSTGTPVVSSSQASGGASSSLEPGRSSATSQPSYNEPVLQRVSEPVPLASGAPNEYVVKVGDTLWDIAGTFLKDPWYWPEIWYVNPDIENPHLIYPGDVLGLVYIDGQPRITNVRGSAYRLSPQARITPLTEAISSIPYEAVAAFLSSGVILEKDQADSLPYLLETRGEHLVAAAGNEIYVRGISGDALGSRYNVVHIGDPLHDPDDNRLIGYEGLVVGEGQLQRGGDPATVALTDTNREALRGDRLLPEVVDLPLNFFPTAPGSVVDGRIISVVGGVTQIGQYQVVVMNRGSNHGLSIGDVLSVFQTGEVIRDRIAGGKVRLPDEQAGTVMVFKTFDRISYGLVMEATQAIHVLDAVRNPIR
ncbi:MAG: LysM peptidoglycan-binding domain-containing protein [Gammaproteobacteria bacterium]|nr:LysM peptidoglycan-binding domain-containing protein [Gammaproteobacteria bacterium]MBU2676157.1 LysM peptidoglycan-binding domain-containing protein [Gammaproteobacteria bacterium]NNC57031.1 LysM peptidoglycan-binding domain-containing protein [Woeseiaceae bacterium]NNL49893.1 LysM peptidoglycan-binding domain-containing protein [Woeseiaceae bacterium]